MADQQGGYYRLLVDVSDGETDTTILFAGEMIEVVERGTETVTVQHWRDAIRATIPARTTGSAQPTVERWS